MKAPTKAQRERWSKVAELGCAVSGRYTAEIHHAKTGAGGRKDHDLVIPLHYDYHRGKNGIHTIGRKKWQALYGSEDDFLIWVKQQLGENDGI